jgi:hypothetical protein
MVGGFLVGDLDREVDPADPADDEVGRVENRGIEDGRNVGG